MLDGDAVFGQGDSTFGPQPARVQPCPGHGATSGTVRDIHSVVHTLWEGPLIMDEGRT